MRTRWGVPAVECLPGAEWLEMMNEGWEGAVGSSSVKEAPSYRRRCMHAVLANGSCATPRSVRTPHARLAPCSAIRPHPPCGLANPAPSPL